MTKEEVLSIIRIKPENAAIVDTSLLDNATIREYADYVDWYMLSQFKNFGVDFMREFIDKLYVPQLWKNKHIKDKDREEIINYLVKHSEPNIFKI